jgi:A/G-specific adenine glycosylase
VSDRELWPLVEASCSREDPRGWYYALLDYGCYLKQVEVNPSRKSAHYTRQSTFAGSRRQKRAYLVREVLAQPGITSAELKSSLDDEERAAGRAGVDDDVFRSIIDDLVAEGFFSPDGEGYRA